MHSTTITSYKHYNSENKLALSLPGHACINDYK